MSNTVEKEYLIKKSIDSFLMAIEVYNKPTIDYRLEGSLFFLHNAWELLLKAYLISQDKSIYYKSSSDSLSLRDCARKCMTNDKDPIRRNLDVIISYINMATHLVIPEYDYIMLPFVSYSVESYAKKLYEYFKINIHDYISMEFLSLFTAKPKKNVNILTKYGSDIDTVFNDYQHKINETIEEAGETSIATSIEINLVRVNNKSKADYTFYNTNNIKEGDIVKYVDRQLDPNSTHTLTRNKLVSEINSYIEVNKIEYIPIREPRKLADGTFSNLFTTHAFDLIAKEYGIKSNTEYCYGFDLGKSTSYKYHPKTITYIISLVQSNMNIVNDIKNKKR